MTTPSRYIYVYIYTYLSILYVISPAGIPVVCEWPRVSRDNAKSARLKTSTCSRSGILLYYCNTRTRPTFRTRLYLNIRIVIISTRRVSTNTVIFETNGQCVGYVGASVGRRTIRTQYRNLRFSRISKNITIEKSRMYSRITRMST